MYQFCSALGPFPGSLGLLHKGFVVNLCVFFFYYAPGVFCFFFISVTSKSKKKGSRMEKNRAMLPYIVAFILCTYFGANLKTEKKH